ncbi:MAG TPA: UDP-3-O-acyl-N-acetylglucosamine deacetylase [bacterium]|nr:UDP-3-O-acyl-N-acetylglucosamine deacetylase [bacterium]
MTVPRQGTIAGPCGLAGRGLHSGQPARLRCLPAPVDTGIVFAAAAGGPEIPARLDAVVGTRRGVSLGRGSRVVRTVEHLLAAAHALGIANLRVEVEGDELPVMDGSAQPYVHAFQAAGLLAQDASWPPVVLGHPAWVTHGTSSVLAIPSTELRVTYVVPTGLSALGTQVVDVPDPPRAFARDLAPARTWGFARELDGLRAEGLALGASEENTLGLGPDGYLWPSRFPDEPARHKVLDLLGDVALLGRPLRAHVIAVAAGHTLHVALARRILETEAT